MGARPLSPPPAAFGLNPGMKHTYIKTGDSGDGLAHGTIAGRLLADLITGKEDAWAKVYSPSRTMSLLQSAVPMLKHDVHINAQYKRSLQSDIDDIGKIPDGEGGVLSPKLRKPIAVYRDESGQKYKLSAPCPHLKGVVC